MADEPKVRLRQLMQTLDRQPTLRLVVRNDRVDVIDVSTGDKTPIWPDKLWGEDDRSFLQRLETVIETMEDQDQ